VFGCYARLLLDVSKPLHDYVLVEMEEFAFHVGVMHENILNIVITIKLWVIIYFIVASRIFEKILHTIRKINLKLKRQ